MVNRKGFTVVQLLVTGVIVGLLLIAFVAVPNVMRQTRNSSRAQDIHVLALVLKDQQAASSTGFLPQSCNNTQPSCFIHDASLALYDNTSTDTVITYYRNTKPYNDELPHLSLDDENVTHKVVMHTYAICDGGELTGQKAGAGSIAMQYAVETMHGAKLVCKAE
jgi:Tfp pilus assembly protein PilW